MLSRGPRRVSPPGGWLTGLALGALLLCLLMASGLPACRCDADDVVATLVKHSGSVERDRSTKVEEWSSADAGARMRIGDGVRTLETSTAELSLVGGAALDMTPKTVIRFLTNMGKDEVGVDVLVGEAKLGAGEQRVRVVSSFGTIVIDPRSRVVLTRDQQRMRFNVLVGRVSVDPSRGSATLLRAGQSLVVDVGGVILERPTPAASATMPPKVSAAAADDPGVDALIFVTADGDGVSVRAPGGSWKTMGGKKTEVAAATGLRVPRGATARVDRGTQSVNVGQGEFVLVPDGGALVQVTEGPVRLHGVGASVRVPGGVIVSKEPGVSADVRVGKSRTEVEVHLGSVEVRGSERDELGSGERGSLTPDGRMTVEGRGPSPAHLFVASGQSFTVHDPAPPTVVGIELPAECAQGAVVTTGKKRWAWNGKRVHVPLDPGRHAYTLHCLTAEGPDAKSAASAVIIVVRDSGVAPIAEKAPRTQISTDGRAYTVLYQNRLPVLSVRWPSPPAEARSFGLHVSGPSGKMTIPASGPTHVFQSGALREGRHTMYFAALTEPARRSRATTVNIVYDSTTPTASIRNPPGSMPGPGQNVTLSGTAVPGWTVAVDGEVMPLGAGARFSATTVVPSDGRAVAIQFQHPQRGVHYYLRRPGGAH